MKNLTIILILLISSFSVSTYGQYTDPIVKGAKEYTYQGEKISKSEIANLILAHGNEEAIQKMKKYQGVRKFGFVTLGVGSVLLVTGTIISLNNFYIWGGTEEQLRRSQRGGRMFAAGFFMTLGSAIPLLLSKKSFKNSLEAYNNGQKVKAELSLQSRPDGLSLKVKF